MISRRPRTSASAAKLTAARIAPAFITAMLIGTLHFTSVAHAAQPATAVTAKNSNGQELTSSKRRALDPNGQTLTIRGKGFNPTVGIYVALCVTPAAGQKPSPCGGGVNVDGSSQASAWISSNPPPYARNLTTPYRPNGSFTTRIKVSPMIGDSDCRIVPCSIVARADHLRANDRSFDVAVPVTFR